MLSRSITGKKVLLMIPPFMAPLVTISTATNTAVVSSLLCMANRRVGL